MVTYNTLISACGKAGKYEEALRIAGAMRSAGHAPDSFTVCSLVAAAGTAARWRSALATFQDFCAAGGRPNTATYNALVMVVPPRVAVSPPVLQKAYLHGNQHTRTNGPLAFPLLLAWLLT